MMKRKCFVALLLSLSLPFLSGCSGSPAPTPIACSQSALIQAIQDANSDGDPTTIELAPDCTYIFYNSYSNSSNASDSNGHIALPPITSPITIHGNNATLEVQASSARHFYISSAGNLTMDNLTLQSGEAIGNLTRVEDEKEGGGAINNDGGVLWATHATFRNNFGGPHGGAIHNRGTLVIEGCLFEGNSSLEGGAIYSVDTEDMPFTISDTLFALNEAGYGGAIFSTGDESNGALHNATFDQNAAQGSGGAIYIQDGTLSVSEGHFTDNWTDEAPFIILHLGEVTLAEYGQGGAIYFEGDSLTVSTSEFNENTALEQGGGIYLAQGSLNLDHSSFSYNEVSHEPGGDSSNGSGDGGGIYNNGQAVIVNSSFTHNWTSYRPGYYGTEDDPFYGDGGAIFNGGGLTISGSTLDRNSAENGGGLFNAGNLTMVNSTIAYNYANLGAGLHNAGTMDISFATIDQNSQHPYLNRVTGPIGAGIYNAGPELNIKNSIVSDNLSSSEVSILDNCFRASGALNDLGGNLESSSWPFPEQSMTCSGFMHAENDYLGALEDNSGPTETMRIRPNDSAAVDAIETASQCTTVAGDPMETDQRGVYRPFNTGDCDIGAYEYDGPSPPPPQPLPAEPTTTPSATPTSTPAACIYVARENSNCRESDYQDSDLMAIVMQGEAVELLAVNPQFTHGRFETQNQTVCWIWLGLLDGPDPLKDCGAAAVEAPTPPPTETPPPACAPDMDAESCKASGGTFDLSSAPPCKCP